MSFKEALSQFADNAKSVAAASGKGRVLQRVSSTYPELRRTALMLMATAALSVVATPAHALTIDEATISGAAQEAGYNHYHFNDKTQSSFSLTLPGVDDNFWRNATPKVIEQAREFGAQGMNSGDIAINQSQSYFKGIASDLIPALSTINEGHHHSDEVLAAHQSSQKLKQALNDYKAIHGVTIPKDIGKDDFDLNRLVANHAHIEDEMMLTAVAIHHDADPAALKDVFGRYVVEHELGHSHVLHDIDSDGGIENETMHEYVADYQGLVQTFSYIAQQYPDDYEALSESLLSSTRLMRLNTGAESDHTGATLSVEMVTDLYQQGNFTLEKVQAMSRDDIEGQAIDIVKSTNKDVVRQEALAISKIEKGPYSERLLSFSWLGDAAEKAAKQMADPEGADYKAAKALYQKQEAKVEVSLDSRLEDRLERLRAKKATNSSPYRFGY